MLPSGLVQRIVPPPLVYINRRRWFLSKAWRGRASVMLGCTGCSDIYPGTEQAKIFIQYVESLLDHRLSRVLACDHLAAVDLKLKTVGSLFVNLRVFR